MSFSAALTASDTRQHENLKVKKHKMSSAGDYCTWAQEASMTRVNREFPECLETRSVFIPTVSLHL